MAGPKKSQGKKRAKNPFRWVLVVVGVGVLVALGLGLYRQSTGQKPSPPAAAGGSALASKSMLKDLSAIPSSTWSAVHVGQSAYPAVVPAGGTGTGKPVVLYMGADYCPYCAAMRWPMVVALSQFGTFTRLPLWHSSAVDIYPSTPTFSFYKSRYQSAYLQLQTVELQSNTRDSQGNYMSLQTPTAQQAKVFNQYDAPPYVPSQQDSGSIPFLLVGGKYLWIGSPYSPKLLGGKTQAAIASTLPSGKGQAAQAILEQAEVITAAICRADGKKPQNVCSRSDVQAAMAQFKK